MHYSAKVLADSIGPNDIRLTTLELTYPRFIHSELMTHRMFSRNTASSRAIPIAKTMHAVRTDPVVPVFWGEAQKGMQATRELTGIRKWLAKQVWLKSRYVALSIAWVMDKLHLHKQLANRMLEPWLHTTVIVTATEWDNWFRLRDSPDAQPEIRALAVVMRRAMEESIPNRLIYGEWHLPLITCGDKLLASTDSMYLQKIAVARCARVSYSTHDKKREHSEDLEMFYKLLQSGHWSPFEHVAMATDSKQWSGNFHGWLQFREKVDSTWLVRS